MKEWKHNELSEDLAAIKGTPFLDVPLGSVFLNHMRKWDDLSGNTPGGTQRADIVDVKPSYTRFNISIYEIKVSRADLLSDLRSGKWRGYLDHCHRFYFAIPSGIGDKKDIPPEAGLVVRGATGWTTVKAAPNRSVEIPQETLLSLLFMKERANHD